MSAQPARTPLSDATIAHEAFGRICGLAFLGAVREAIPVPIPFNYSFARHIDAHGKEMNRIKELISQAFDLSPDVMSIFDDARNKLPDSIQTADSVVGWLAMYTLNRVPLELDLGDFDLVRRAAQFGVKRQLYGFAGEMTIALAERTPRDLSQFSAIRQAVTEGASLGGEPDPAAAGRQGYEAWCVADLTTYLDPKNKAVSAEERSRLREVVDQLDAAFGIG